MLWKSYFLEFEANPEVHQWDELLGKSPWDFVEAPQWAGAEVEDSSESLGRYWESPMDEEAPSESTLEDAKPENGRWEINPVTGIRIWIPYE